MKGGGGARERANDMQETDRPCLTSWRGSSRAPVHSVHGADMGCGQVHIQCAFNSNVLANNFTAILIAAVNNFSCVFIMVIFMALHLKRL